MRNRVYIPRVKLRQSDICKHRERETCVERSQLWRSFCRGGSNHSGKFAGKSESTIYSVRIHSLKGREFIVWRNLKTGF